MELTILMPCLDEAQTVANCVATAREYLESRHLDGEVLVADNGSTDGSIALAIRAGARVIAVERRGYGAALSGGIEAARGRFVIMGDADGSYDFSDLDGFIALLRNGQKLVMGNRFRGGIKPGAMPWLNRYLGNPVLSFVGRLLFGSSIGDFHCGLRGFEREAILALHLQSPGMEFASEMVVKASLADIPIAETPITLRPDGRGRPPHLRRWRDGWRHLSLMLLRSPDWLFLYPGLCLAVLGLVGTATLAIRSLPIAHFLTLDINALLYCGAMAAVGVQIVLFALIARAYAVRLNIRVGSGAISRWLPRLPIGKIIAGGAVLAAFGFLAAMRAIVLWGELSFGALVPGEMMRLTIPAVTAVSIGAQLIFGGFLLGFIGADH